MSGAQAGWWFMRVADAPASFATAVNAFRHLVQTRHGGTALTADDFEQYLFSIRTIARLHDVSTSPATRVDITVHTMVATHSPGEPPARHYQGCNTRSGNDVLQQLRKDTNRWGSVSACSSRKICSHVLHRHPATQQPARAGKPQKPMHPLESHCGPIRLPERPGGHPPVPAACSSRRPSRRLALARGL